MILLLAESQQEAESCRLFGRKLFVGRKQNYADSLGRKLFITHSSLDRKQKIEEVSAEAIYDRQSRQEAKTGGLVNTLW